MNIVDKGDQLVIDLGNGLRSRVKILFGVYAIGTLIVLVFLVGVGLVSLQGSVFATIFCLGIAALYFIATKYFFLKVFGKEQLVLNETTLTLSNGASVWQRSRSFDISGISGLQYTGFQKTTDHPLKGQSFDYIGLETQQQVVNTLHDEGNLSFTYDGKTVHFGKDVYSWTAEELNTAISAFTKGRLTIANLPEFTETE